MQFKEKDVPLSEEEAVITSSHAESLGRCTRTKRAATQLCSFLPSKLRLSSFLYIVCFENDVFPPGSPSVPRENSVFESAAAEKEK